MAKASELQVGQTISYGAHRVTITCVAPHPTHAGWVRISGTYRRGWGASHRVRFTLLGEDDVLAGAVPATRA